MTLTDAEREAVERGAPITIGFADRDERRATAAPCPMPRPRCLAAQDVAPRGAGLPRRSTAAGVAFTLLVIATTVLYGLAAYGLLVLWRALP